MKIELARSAGFCYGVRRAVAMAEQAAAEGRPCAMLGPVIHNRSVTDYLRSLGVGLIQSPEEAAPGTAADKLITLAVIAVAVAAYGVLLLVLHAVDREDMLLLPKGEKIANILHLK